MKKPLEGVRLLDLSIWRPGPYAASLLCALGADVLKVEPPGGDPMRYYVDLFASVNSGKRSIVLDLKRDADRARALELAGQADALIEGFRPGVMARLALGEPAVRRANPRIVYCSISGYGQNGPLAQLPGHDVNYQAWAGALSPDGATAAMPPLPIADLASGMTAAFGMCAALFGGEGAYLDISMTDVLATWTGDVGASNGSSRPASSGGTEGATSVPGYGIYTTADGLQVALGVVNEAHFWSALCHAIGLDDEANLTFEMRQARHLELHAAVATAVGQHQRAALVSTLLAAGVPIAPVLDRSGMVANAPFPTFPIRWPAASAEGGVPTLNQHHGEGFVPTT
jgi:crotonobetainyl-CoA:carnitine CoA-transferase CaiB-like acyl-CoA transferase